MALIKCPECGRSNVSDTAKACPGCGYNIASKTYAKFGLCPNCGSVGYGGPLNKGDQTKGGVLRCTFCGHTM